MNLRRVRVCQTGHVLGIDAKDLDPEDVRKVILMGDEGEEDRVFTLKEESS